MRIAFIWLHVWVPLQAYSILKTDLAKTAPASSQLQQVEAVTTRTTTTTTRRESLAYFLSAAITTTTTTTAARIASVASLITASPEPAVAFSGSGSSAYSGRSPQSLEQRRKSYQDRVAADIRDFNALGKALQQGKTAGDDNPIWTFFFIPFQRNSPDAVGRTYAALADFVGHKSDSGALEGSAGYLLAATFTKPGKPPDNTPAVQSYKKLAPTFALIQKAGEKGDAVKAKEAWDNASVLFSKYLEQVEMPSNLDDPLYH